MKKKIGFLFFIILMFSIIIYLGMPVFYQVKTTNEFIPRFEECLEFSYKSFREKEFLRNVMSCTTYFKEESENFSQDKIDELYDEMIKSMPESLDIPKKFEIIKEGYAFQSADKNKIKVYFGKKIKNKVFQSTYYETWSLINGEWYKDDIKYVKEKRNILIKYHGYFLIK